MPPRIPRIPAAKLGAALEKLAQASKEAELAQAAAEAKAAQEAAGAVLSGKKAAPQRGILATPDLRTMGAEDAAALARKQPHLQQDPGGQYIGAPRGVETRQQITNMRRAFDKDVAAGAAGGDWYKRARGFNQEIAGSDPARQRLVAREQALWSPQATPDTNMNFQLQAHNAYEMGEPLAVARTGAQARTYQQARDAGVDIPLGKKTGIYGEHLDPTVPFATTGTNDIWHARGFGYTNKGGELFSRALTPQEHRFLDYETVLAADRANKRGLAGRSDWQAHEIQAAPWVAGKGRSLAEKSGGAKTLEQGVAEASMTYPDYADKYTAFGTHEQTPGVMTGHLPDLVSGPAEARAAYAADPRSSWTGNTGRDQLYDALGFYQRDTLPTTGIYTPPGGVQEVNPGRAARPLVGMQAGGAGVDPASRRGLDLAEASRAYVDAQGAGAWHKPVLNAQAGKMGSVFTRLEGPLPAEKVGRLQEIGRAHGLPDVVDTGQGVTMTNFAGAPGGAATGKALRSAGGLGTQVAEALGSEPRRAFVDSGYVPMFEKGTGPGTGEVTREFLGRWRSAPASVQEKLEGPIKAKAWANFQRDADVAAKTGQPVRADIQNARQIVATKGVAALEAALKAGKVSLPAFIAALGLGAASQLPGAQPAASALPGARAVRSGA